MNFKSNLFFSPLEQFEISSYNIFFNYITTFPLELYENFYIVSLDQISFYTIFDLIFIFFIIKGFEFFLKNHSFIFLYVLILILLTCLNINSFVDFVSFQGAFDSRFNIDNKRFDDLITSAAFQYSNNIAFMFKREFNITMHIFMYLDALIENYYEPLINNSTKLIAWNEDKGIFISKVFIPNIILNFDAIIAYTWFLVFLFQNTYVTNSYDILNLELIGFLSNIDTLEDLGQNLLTNPLANTLTTIEKLSYHGFYEQFLFRYNFMLNIIQDLISDNHENYEHESGFEVWSIFLIILTAFSIAAYPQIFNKVTKDFSNDLLDQVFKDEFKNLYYQTISPCALRRCGQKISSTENLIEFVQNNVNYIQISNIFESFMHIAKATLPYIYCLDRINFDLKNTNGEGSIDSIYKFHDILIRNNNLFTFFKSDDQLLAFADKLDDYFEINTLIYSKLESYYFFITLNTSFINIYSIIFCFIFIYLIIYLIFNKNLSINTNSLIPNIYQVFGENLYKISLNLFYSVLGKNITHPEFFIKINTIFIFLIISNVQGMIPYISTLTSALTNTFFIALALFISILITLFDKKGLNYFLNLFMPAGCPIFLVFLLIPIEFISYSFRVVSLSVRLFANMMAGHTLLKVIVGFSWVIVFLENMFLINIFPIVILFILTLLEFGVALIQAYIFTILSCIYLRDIFQGH